MKLLIGADVVPTNSNEQYFIDGKLDLYIEKSIINIINDHDFRIFNLEAPLFDGESPILKCGPNLKCKTTTIKGLKQIQTNLFTLANNHIMDHGLNGFNSTINVLRKNGIDIVGAGKNICSAKEPYIYKDDKVKVGIYACCEHEFSCATKTELGANPFDALSSFDDLKELKNKVDYAIVLYHGGKEYYRYPSPSLQRVCRKFVDSGADLVICQHSHCIGCEENYRNSKIVYGQGNFIFDLKSDEYWNSAILISVSLMNNMGTIDSKIKYIPISKTNSGIQMCNDSSSLKLFQSRSNDIIKEGFVEKAYLDFSKSYYWDYMVSLRGKKNYFERILNRLTKGASRKCLIKSIHNKRSLATVLNYIECEAHRELLMESIKNKMNE